MQEVGLDRIVVSIKHCGCFDPGSIPGLVIFFLCLEVNLEEVLQCFAIIDNLFNRELFLKPQPYP